MAEEKYRLALSWGLWWWYLERNRFTPEAGKNGFLRVISET
jgi:hypothetical protein